MHAMMERRSCCSGLIERAAAPSWVCCLATPTGEAVREQSITEIYVRWLSPRFRPPEGSNCHLRHANLMGEQTERAFHLADETLAFATQICASQESLRGAILNFCESNARTFSSWRAVSFWPQLK